MHITHLIIRNFRALSDIECDLTANINVIVGPNAIGKTTILQAIRLVKALLAPRTQQETQQVLISLGAASPHFPQALFLKGLARDTNLPVEIRCTYRFTPAEIGTLRFSSVAVVQAIVASRLGNSFSNPASLIQFMQSPQGQQQFAAISEEVKLCLTKLDSDPTLTLGISFNAAGQQIAAVDPMAGSLIAFLDQRLPPSTAIFTYFPADRALPVGDVNMQIGGPDSQQQLETHNSQPQLKYVRLKHLIINSLVLEQPAGQSVKDQFEKIFPS